MIVDDEIQIVKRVKDYQILRKRMQKFRRNKMRRFKFIHFPVDLFYLNFLPRIDGMALYKRIERL